MGMYHRLAVAQGDVSDQACNLEVLVDVDELVFPLVLVIITDASGLDSSYGLDGAEGDVFFLTNVGQLLKQVAVVGQFAHYGSFWFDGIINGHSKFHFHQQLIDRTGQDCQMVRDDYRVYGICGQERFGGCDRDLSGLDFAGVVVYDV